MLFELRRIRRSFSPGEVVLDINDLVLESGPRAGRPEVLCFVGPNASGKSTLLYLLALLDAPSPSLDGSMSLRVMGEDVLSASAATRDGLRWRSMGISFQNTCLLPYLSVRENIRMPRALTGQAYDAEFVEELCCELGLVGDFDRPVDELSSGQRRRVALARSMATWPEVLFLDEPTESLDRPGIEWLGRFIRGETRPGGYQPRTILLISHELGFVASVGTRFYGVRESRVWDLSIPPSAKHKEKVGVLAGVFAESVLEAAPQPLASAPVAEGRRDRDSGDGLGAVKAKALARYAWGNVFHGRNRKDTAFQVIVLVAMVLASIGLLKIMIASAALRYDALTDPFLNRLEVFTASESSEELNQEEIDTLRGVMIEQPPSLTPMRAFLAAGALKASESSYPHRVRGAAGVRSIRPILSVGGEEFHLRGGTYLTDDLMLSSLRVLAVMEPEDRLGEELVVRSAPVGSRVAEVLRAFEDVRARQGFDVVIIKRRSADRVFSEEALKPGASVTPVTVSQSSAAPASVRVIIVDGLPYGFECIIEENFYKDELFNVQYPDGTSRRSVHASGDELIQYESVSVYLDSLFEVEGAIKAIEKLNGDARGGAGSGIGCSGGGNTIRRFRVGDEILRKLEVAEAEMEVLGATVLGAFGTTFGLTMLALWVIFRQRVSRRSREIGVLRSIGAGIADVFWTFCAEGALIWTASAVVWFGFFIGLRGVLDRCAANFVATSEEIAVKILPMMSLPWWVLPLLLATTFLMVGLGSIGAWHVGKARDIATYLRGEAQ